MKKPESFGRSIAVFLAKSDGRCTMSSSPSRIVPDIIETKKTLTTSRDGGVEGGRGGGLRGTVGSEGETGRREEIGRRCCWLMTKKFGSKSLYHAIATLLAVVPVLNIF